MIAPALIGAAIFGGLALAAAGVKLSEDGGVWWPIVAVIGVTAFGGGVGAMVSTWDGEPCPAGYVMAGADNEILHGCIPVDLAKLQIEGDF